MSINDHYIQMWHEAEQPVAGGSPSCDPMSGATAGNAPGSPPPQGGPGPGPVLQGAGDNGNSQTGSDDDQSGVGDDISNDPQSPEGMDNEEGHQQDFEQWQQNFFKLAVKGDLLEMMQSLDP